MPKMIDDKQKKRGDCEFLFSGNVMASRWMNNRSVLLLSSALEGINGISVQRREKGSKTKSLVPCPKVVKLYNSGMVGVDVIDQRSAAYRLDWKSAVRFYKNSRFLQFSISFLLYQQYLSKKYFHLKCFQYLILFL